MLVSGCPFTLTFLLQAWRKYDSDRSGYIESNELKVKYEVRKCVTRKVNARLLRRAQLSGEPSLTPTLPRLSAGSAARSATHQL